MSLLDAPGVRAAVEELAQGPNGDHAALIAGLRWLDKLPTRTVFQRLEPRALVLRAAEMHAALTEGTQESCAKEAKAIAKRERERKQRASAPELTKARDALSNATRALSNARRALAKAEDVDRKFPGWPMYGAEVQRARRRVADWTAKVMDRQQALNSLKQSEPAGAAQETRTA